MLDSMANQRQSEDMMSVQARADAHTTDVETLAARRQVIIASNRGPVEFQREHSGRLTTKRGPGGVVTALASLANDIPLTWVATALTEGDRVAFPDLQSPARQVRLGTQHLRVRYVPLSKEVQRWHYDDVSNRILWFLQHYMADAAFGFDFTEQDYRHWDQGYRVANAAVAQAICQEAHHQCRSAGGRNGSEVIVLLQDYHFYLAPATVRQKLPRAVIQQFIHIPWPALRYWGFLPQTMLEEIFAGLAANDVLGLQTEPDVRNFLACAEELLPNCQVDYAKGTLYWRRHRTLVRSYPIPVDTSEIRDSFASAAGRRGVRELAPLLGGETKTIVRVDRLDPSKNIIRGFKAYELLLQRHPELHGNVRFLAFLVPSREQLTVYQRYDREVRKIIKRINARYGTAEWRPVVPFFENNRPRALAAMSRYDVLLVNPNIDGMNLVAKEGPIINDTDGVVVLSRTAGAYHQLAEAVLPVTPTDVEETAERLYEALNLPLERRHELAQRAREIASAETPTEWAIAQLRDASHARHLHRRPTALELHHLSRAG
jgi:trehalose 6-phosphate synthase